MRLRALVLLYVWNRLNKIPINLVEYFQRTLSARFQLTIKYFWCFEHIFKSRMLSTRNSVRLRVNLWATPSTQAKSSLWRLRGPALWSYLQEILKKKSYSGISIASIKCVWKYEKGGVVLKASLLVNLLAANNYMLQPYLRENEEGVYEVITSMRLVQGI